MTGVDMLVDKYLNDADFRRDLLADPAAAVASAGLDLSAEDWDGVRTVVGSMGDAELAARISKGSMN